MLFKQAQRTMEITDWICYFSLNYIDAQKQAKTINQVHSGKGQISG